MTVRATTLKGVEAGGYYLEALPRYYLDRDEPPGVWRGAGAVCLGLNGDLIDEAFLAVMAGLDPITGERLGRRYGEDSVRGFDVTASAPKSVSVLFALGEESVRQAVLDAHDIAVGAMIDWVEAHAHTRFRIHGDVAIVDAEGIVAALFRQHTSRGLDPQLHTHVVIANRVQSPDGRWLALDARTIKLDQRTLSAVYHASLRAELTAHLGVSWREPVNGIAELATIPDDVLAEFSSRTQAVQDRVDVKLERFCARFARDPTPRERWRLEREAVVDSRPAKTHGVDATALHAEWAERVTAIGCDPGRVVADAVATQAVNATLDPATVDAIVAQALIALEERQSTWRPAELVRELAAATPTNLAVSAAELVLWLDRLADQVTAEQLVDVSRPIPAEVMVRRDGRPVSESVADRAITTPAILAEEELLLTRAQARLARGGADESAVAERAADQLTGPQLEVAAAVAGTRDLVVIVGPAGTGKTTALAPAVAELRRQGRAVFGVAPSAGAAEVLAVEVGVDADTLDKLLIEQRLQRRPDPRFDLPSGTTVLVDEAAMVPTPKLAHLFALADQRGWRLALIGDPLQFSAVGRGGMFAHLVDTHDAIELDRVHRFTHEWERDASLRLRRGDQTVVDLYRAHGRLHGGNRQLMEAAVVNAWSAAGARGETVAMMAPTNDLVVSLNHRAQQRRARDGELDLTGPHVSVGVYQIHLGDLIATRQNQRDLRTDRGHMIKNRDQWHIAAIHPDGALTVTGSTGTVRLPGGYVVAHVELAYAQTSHANQGRTVDRSLLLLDGPTDSRGVYVPMTRGRHANDAYIVTRDEQTPADVLAEALSRNWIDQPAVARRAELHAEIVSPERRVEPRAALGPSALRHLLEREHELSAKSRDIDFDVADHERQVTRAQNRRTRLLASITDDQLRLDQALTTIDDLDRPFRRRRHRGELNSATQTADTAARAIDRQRAKLAQLDEQIPAHEQALATAQAKARQRPELDHERRTIRDSLEADASARAASFAVDAPQYLTAHLGRRPANALAASLWDDAAARIDQHRTAFDVTDRQDLLGRTPRYNDGAYTTSHQAALEACQRLERALGQDLGIGRPELDLGLSL